MRQNLQCVEWRMRLAALFVNGEDFLKAFELEGGMNMFWRGQSLLLATADGKSSDSRSLAEVSEFAKCVNIPSTFQVATRQGFFDQRFGFIFADADALHACVYLEVGFDPLTGGLCQLFSSSQQVQGRCGEG